MAYSNMESNLFAVLQHSTHENKGYDRKNNRNTCDSYPGND